MAVVLFFFLFLPFVLFLVFIGKESIHDWFDRDNNKGQSQRFEYFIHDECQAKFAICWINLRRQIPIKLRIDLGNHLHGIEIAHFDTEPAQQKGRAKTGPIPSDQWHAIVAREHLVLSRPRVAFTG
jgi:hypothetical protein